MLGIDTAAELCKKALGNSADKPLTMEGVKDGLPFLGPSNYVQMHYGSLACSARVFFALDFRLGCAVWLAAFAGGSAAFKDRT